MRGTPQQIIDKYNQLTRDAFLSNDRVAGENFQQHAEHYTRLLGEAQREIDARRQQAEQQNRERQQRDKDTRSERADTQTNAGADQPAPGEGDQPDLATAPQLISPRTVTLVWSKRRKANRDVSRHAPVNRASQCSRTKLSRPRPHQLRHPR